MFWGYIQTVLELVTWTPCVGTFLGSALMLAATANHVIEGAFMLLCFSLGLAIPFLISAFLIHKLKKMHSELPYVMNHLPSLEIQLSLKLQ